MARRALVTGCSKVPDHYTPLPGVEIDVQRMADCLEDKSVGAFEVKRCLNPDVETLKREIEDFFKTLKPDDTAVFYFAGHGDLGFESELFLIAADTAPTLLPVTAVGADMIHRVSTKSPCQKQVIILDCCHSGAIAGQSRSEWELDHVLPQSFSGGVGRYILASARPSESAMEGGQGSEGGWFTSQLVHGIRTRLDGDAGGNQLTIDGEITVDALFNYTAAKVVGLPESERRQNPRRYVSAEADGQIVIAYPKSSRSGALETTLEDTSGSSPEPEQHKIQPPPPKPGPEAMNWPPPPMPETFYEPNPQQLRSPIKGTEVSPMRRVAARLIDLLAWLLVAFAASIPMAIVYILGVSQEQLDAISSGQQSLVLTQFEMGVAEAVVWMAIAMYETAGVWLFGCTAGKAVTGLRVKPRDPARSRGFSTAALRASPLALIAAVVLLELAIVGSIAISRSLTMLVALICLLLVSVGRSTVWDELAKTEVVTKIAATQPRSRQ